MPGRGLEVTQATPALPLRHRQSGDVDAIQPRLRPNPNRLLLRSSALVGTV